MFYTVIFQDCKGQIGVCDVTVSPVFSMLPMYWSELSVTLELSSF